MKPNLQKLWDAFPDHPTYPTMKDLYIWLGGTAASSVGSPGFPADGNTCASRLSVAFNNGGAPISKATVTAAHAHTLKAGDGSLIIYRVAEFRRYLQHAFGKSSVDTSSPYDSDFQGKRGIVAFSVNWANATGHIALFDGAAYREPDHDNYATYADPDKPSVHTSRAEFWQLS